MVLEKQVQEMLRPRVELLLVLHSMGVLEAVAPNWIQVLQRAILTVHWVLTRAPMAAVLSMTKPRKVAQSKLAHLLVCWISLPAPGMQPPQLD